MQVTEPPINYSEILFLKLRIIHLFHLCYVNCIYFKRVFKLNFREKGRNIDRNKECNIDWLPPIPHTGNRALNPGKHPYGELDQ